MKRFGFRRIAAIALSGALLLSGCGKTESTEQQTAKDTQTEASSDTKTEDTTADTETTDTEATEKATEEKKDLNISDGQVIVGIDFDDGETGKFSSYTKGGKFQMENVDGKLVVHIESIGSVDYANQIYYDGFQLLQGGVYTYSFDVSSTIERQIEYRLQINGGDFHAYQGEYIQVGPETKHVEVDFTMAEESDPAPRIVFNMGFMSDMTGDPGPHDVIFDNIELKVKDASNAQKLEGLPDYPSVNVNQIGYLPGDTKTVIVKSQRTETFQVVDASTGAEVFSGTFGEFGFHAPSDDVVRAGDFSAVTTPGTYKIVTDVGETYPFVIGEGVYADVFKAIVRMLYLQRCGIELTEAEAGEFSHKACHLGDAIVYGEQKKLDVTGGWHDAGDYGRYVVAGAKTVQDLLLAYEDYQVKEDDLGIPESGNGIPDILDEAKYELDWMLKMQDSETGGVYHKVSCYNFPETVKADEEVEQLVLSPISATATGDFAAVMAKASRIYRDYNPDFAAACASAAWNAWLYIETLPEKPEGFRNPEGVETGEYKDNNTTDELFWAAVELYLSGYTEVNIAERYEALGLGIEFGWADITGYACYDLLTAVKNGTVDSAELGDLVAKVEDRFYSRVQQLEERADEYFMMLNSDYPWGSNMTIANNGMLMQMAYLLTGKESYKVLAKRQLDYLLGVNPLGYCFVTGFGSMSPKQPHHRPSQVAGKAMPGMLIGGADNGLEDSYAKAVLYGRPAGMCYADNAQSFSTNEITIYWNSPLIYLMAAYQ